MRDYVFIGWSRNKDLAIKIKDILDEKGFNCVIGGDYENNPENLRIKRTTVNETVNYQMNHCDQSIMLFQKVDDNKGISENLIYELGYIQAQYNYIDASTKIHIFKLDISAAEEILFPTDIHGIWGTPIFTANKTMDELANEIANEFLRNQIQIKPKSKFDILCNHHFVEYEMQRHLKNPSMSDYDFATLLLVYVQASFCYQEQQDIKLKIENFKTRLHSADEKTEELEIVTNYAMQTLNLYCMTIPDENDNLSMKGSEFRSILSDYRDIGEKMIEKFSIFSEYNDLSEILLSRDFICENPLEALLISQVQEHTTYLILVYLTNPNVEPEEREKYAKLGIKYCETVTKNLELLTRDKDLEMYAKLLLSYAYKNYSTFNSQLNNLEECRKTNIKAFKIRKELNSYVNNLPLITPTLKNYINLEYLLQLVERIEELDDKYEISDSLSEIESYIKEYEQFDKNKKVMFNMLLDKYKVLKG